jgi:hypothetical protein
MISLELFQSIFEFNDVEAMIGIEVIDLEGLGHFFFLVEDLLNLGSAVGRPVLLSSHLFIKVIIINQSRTTTF